MVLQGILPILSFIAKAFVAINPTVQYSLRAIGSTHFSNIPA